MPNDIKSQLNQAIHNERVKLQNRKSLEELKYKTDKKLIAPLAEALKPLKKEIDLNYDFINIQISDDHVSMEFGENSWEARGNLHIKIQNDGKGYAIAEEWSFYGEVEERRMIVNSVEEAVKEFMHVCAKYIAVMEDYPDIITNDFVGNPY